MNDLDTTLHGLVETFVENLREAIRDHALLAFSGSSSTKKGPGRPKTVKSASAPKARAKVGRRSEEQIKKTLSDVLTFIKGHKGTRSEEIRKELGLSPTQTGDALLRLLDSKAPGGKRISKKGKRRATSYAAV